MRVALLTSELHWRYGWASYTVELARSLRDRGIDTVTLTQAGSRADAEYAALTDLRPILPSLVPRARGFLARLWLAADRAQRAVADCDLLHIIAEPYAPLGLWSKRPVVVTAHGTYVPQTVGRRVVGRLYRRAYQKAHLIAVSEYTARQVRAALPGVEVRVIRNGVRVDRFRAPAPAPHKLGPTILATGGVKRRKGTHLLVEAMTAVREQIRDAQLVITGNQDPPYLTEVEAQIARLGLADCVHILGMIDEDALRGWYQHADLFALPSLTVGGKFEGFGLVFLEASACGLPVVGAQGSGVAEAVIDGKTGLLIPQDDADALASALIRLLADETLRQELGTAGRAYAETQDWSQVAAQIIALYEQIGYS
jgi:glycosyltransferase involved in cell wall biosynthesis